MKFVKNISAPFGDHLFFGKALKLKDILCFLPGFALISYIYLGK